MSSQCKLEIHLTKVSFKDHKFRSSSKIASWDTLNLESKKVPLSCLEATNTETTVFFIEPTVFADVTADMKIVTEEIFGPVVVISKFEDEEDIIRQANDSVYGLAAAVFAKEITRAISVAHRLKAGTVWVNCYNQLNPQMPFGGYKASGFGRELGEYALANYTNVKAVHINLTGTK